MKKILCILFMVLMLFVIIAPVLAETGETYLMPTPEELREEYASEPDPQKPFTWSYLATIAGTAAFTLLFVQFFKVPLDKVWKIPTRIFVYVVALIVMLISTYFASGLTMESAALAVCNALMAAFTAYGAYEVTFAKLNR